MVRTKGLEPINWVFSPLPMIASLGAFIAYTVTNKANTIRHYMRFFGQSWEENHVQMLCNKTVCANLCKYIPIG
jgi:hypothetical protein